MTIAVFHTKHDIRDIEIRSRLGVLAYCKRQDIIKFNIIFIDYGTFRVDSNFQLSCLSL